MCEDSEVASTIYLNGFYENTARKGQPFGEIVRRICAVYMKKNKPDRDLNMDFLMITPK